MTLSSTGCYDTGTARLVSVTYPQRTGATSANASYTYLDNDLLSTVTDANGGTKYTYDALNRVTAKARCTTPGCTPVLTADSSTNFRLLYTYKPGDIPLASTQYWNQGTVNYTTDVLGRVATVADWSGAASTYAYAVTGQVASVARNGNAFDTAYTYDTARRLSAIAHTGPGGKLLLSLGYPTRDAVGNIEAITEQWNTEALLSHAFAYDALNRITTINQPALPAHWGGSTNALVPALKVTNAYDPEGNATTYLGAPYAYNANGESTAFTYDANGNLLH